MTTTNRQPLRHAVMALAFSLALPLPYSGTMLHAQSTLPYGTTTVDSYGLYEYNLPYGATAITVTAHGADGGKGAVVCEGSLHTAAGGAGARVSAGFSIGQGPGQLQPGGRLRLVVGQQGESRSKTDASAVGGGGGGTALLYQSTDESEWTILLVAGAGGGGAQHIASSNQDIFCSNTEPGQGGRDAETGGGSNGGTNGAGGFSLLGSGGGGAFSEGHPFGGAPGFPAGGKGSKPFVSQAAGGFGFGGGGSTLGIAAGSGGGYSGGGGVYIDDNDNIITLGGGGGGSFLTSAFTLTKPVKIAGSTTLSPQDGSVVIDVINSPPVARCLHPQVVLDAQGLGSLSIDAVDAGSTDAGGIEARTLSRTTFSCADIAPVVRRRASVVPVTLTVADDQGLTATCVSRVTVIDNTAPQAVCRDLTISLPREGRYHLQPAQLDGGSDDACGVALSISKSVLSCADLGTQPVQLTVRDASNNPSSCMAMVTVQSGAAPCPAALLGQQPPTVAISGVTALEIYPNPARESVQVTPPSGSRGGTLAIYDELGRLIQTYVLDGDQRQIVLDRQGAMRRGGLYFVTWRDDIGQHAMGRIVLLP